MNEIYYMTENKKILAKDCLKSKLFSKEGLLKTHLKLLTTAEKDAYLVVAYDENTAVGCAYFFENSIMIFVKKDYRKKSIGRNMIEKLKNTYDLNTENMCAWPGKLGIHFFKKMKIEHSDGIKFYQQLGYEIQIHKKLVV